MRGLFLITMLSLTGVASAHRDTGLKPIDPQISDSYLEEDYKIAFQRGDRKQVRFLTKQLKRRYHDRGDDDDALRDRLAKLQIEAANPPEKKVYQHEPKQEHIERTPAAPKVRVVAEEEEEELPRPKKSASESVGESRAKIRSSGRRASDDKAGPKRHRPAKKALDRGRGETRVPKAPKAEVVEPADSDDATKPEPADSDDAAKPEPKADKAAKPEKAADKASDKAPASPAPKASPQAEKAEDKAKPSPSPAP